MNVLWGVRLAYIQPIKPPLAFRGKSQERGEEVTREERVGCTKKLKKTPHMVCETSLKSMCGPHTFNGSSMVGKRSLKSMFGPHTFIEQNPMLLME
jgi:hypothetical protein